MIKLFFNGFLQVILVVFNTYCVSKDLIFGIVVCSFSISYVWTHNVKKAVMNNEAERVVYSLGAMTGGVFGYFIGSFLKHSI